MFMWVWGHRAISALWRSRGFLVTREGNCGCHSLARRKRHVEGLTEQHINASRQFVKELDDARVDQVGWSPREFRVRTDDRFGCQILRHLTSIAAPQRMAIASRPVSTRPASASFTKTRRITPSSGASSTAVCDGSAGCPWRTSTDSTVPASLARTASASRSDCAEASLASASVSPARATAMAAPVCGSARQGPFRRWQGRHALLPDAPRPPPARNASFGFTRGDRVLSG